MGMVDVSDKPKVLREATAEGIIKLRSKTVELIKSGKIQKGDPLVTAQIAGILAAKKTSNLIPLCHPLPLTKVVASAEILDDERVKFSSTVKTTAQTGVEMEALAAVAVGLLTIWDMVKQYEKDKKGQYPCTQIENIHVVNKTKGKAL